MASSVLGAVALSAVSPSESATRGWNFHAPVEFDPRVAIRPADRCQWATATRPSSAGLVSAGWLGVTRTV